MAESEAKKMRKRTMFDFFERDKKDSQEIEPDKKIIKTSGCETSPKSPEITPDQSRCSPLVAIYYHFQCSMLQWPQLFQNGPTFFSSMGQWPNVLKISAEHCDRNWECITTI